MRRNNYVFLFGRVSRYTVHTSLPTNDRQEPLPHLIDLHLATERDEASGLHRILVRGQQAEELQLFLDLCRPHLPDLAILGWLSARKQQNLVMAERVTVLTDRTTRAQVAAALERRRSQSPTPLPPETLAPDTMLSQESRS